MDAQTALFHLDLVEQPPLDVLEELVEERCFEVRDYFLRNAVIPELYESRARRLERIAEAAEQLGAHYAAHPSETNHVAFTANTLTQLLKDFEAEQAGLRTRISASLNPRELAVLAHGMIALQLAYEDRFFALTAAFGMAKEAVKAADHLDTGRVLHHIALYGEPQATKEGSIREAIENERRRISDRRARERRL